MGIMSSLSLHIDWSVSFLVSELVGLSVIVHKSKVGYFEKSASAQEAINNTTARD